MIAAAYMKFKFFIQGKEIEAGRLPGVARPVSGYCRGTTIQIPYGQNTKLPIARVR